MKLVNLLPRGPALRSLLSPSLLSPSSLPLSLSRAPPFQMRAHTSHVQPGGERVWSTLYQAVSNGRTRFPIEVFPSPPHPGDPDPAGGVRFERLRLFTDTGEQGLTPIIVATPVAPDEAGTSGRQLPAVIYLHGTGSSKEACTESLRDFASRGYVAVAPDSRYHGERDPWREDPRGQDKTAACESVRERHNAQPEILSKQSFFGSPILNNDALVRAWRGESSERPFLIDTVWDLMGVLDYLESRPDVDPGRIGMTGISLGGMHTWLAAALDDRVYCAAPLIGIQNFTWALDNDSYHARCQSIPQLFKAAVSDMDSPGLTPDVVRSVWDKLLPGLLGKEGWDTESSLPLLAPRPLLIANGGEDPRCPVEGLRSVFDAVRKAYIALGAADNFEVFIDEGVPHRLTTAMTDRASQFLDKHLKPERPLGM